MCPLAWLEHMAPQCLPPPLLSNPPQADSGLNYIAILETAADVAKGMLHLHNHQVIHADLKVSKRMQLVMVRVKCMLPAMAIFC